MAFNCDTDWLTPVYLAGYDPSDPPASPLYADADGLPPQFVQAWCMGGADRVYRSLCGDRTVPGRSRNL